MLITILNPFLSINIVMDTWIYLQRESNWFKCRLTYIYTFHASKSNKETSSLVCPIKVISLKSNIRNRIDKQEA